MQATAGLTGEVDLLPRSASPAGTMTGSGDRLEPWRRIDAEVISVPRDPHPHPATPAPARPIWPDRTRSGS